MTTQDPMAAQRGATQARGPATQALTRPAQSGALAPRQPTTNDVAGNFTNPDDIRVRLERAAKYFNLIGPATAATPPIGCEIAINSILLSSDPSKGDVYDAKGGKWGLSKSAIDRIALAAGVKVVESTMLNYASRMCSYRVTVEVRRFDGSTVHQTATKLMDLRPGSPYLASLTELQAKQQLAMLPAHTETKARLRATRALLGIRSYTAEELRLPFVTAAIMFTGRTEDPELKKLFAVGMMQQFLGASSSMYAGQQQQPLQQLGAAAPAIGMLGSGGHALPLTHVATTGGYAAVDLTADADDEPYDGETGEVTTKVVAPGDPARIYMPGKKGEAKLIKDAADKDLVYWAGRIQTALDEGTSSFPDKDAEKLATIKAQIALRAGPAAAAPAAAPIQEGVADGLDGYGNRDPANL
jgi:hypothetical protein